MKFITPEGDEIIFPNGHGTYLVSESSHAISGHILDMVVEGEESRAT